MRRFPWWKKAAEYYPMSLVKTAELDPSKGYVFGFHPHGIISASAFVAFATEGLDVAKVFPGVQSVNDLTPRSFKKGFISLLMLSQSHSS